MHSTLLEKVPVLSLAPDSIANLGELDSGSLSELWAVFTKCKDSLQNGRRLENLMWRTWFDSGRRIGSTLCDPGGAEATTSDDFRVQAQQNGWSDPEWQSESEDGSDMLSQKSPDSSVDDSLLRRPSSSARTSSRERRTSGTIRGDSLQRIIQDLTAQPALLARPKGSKALSTSVVPVQKEAPIPPSRGSSAPEVPTPIMSPSSRPARPNVDALTQTTPRPSARTTPHHSPRPSAGKIALPSLSSLAPPNKPVVTLTPAQGETACVAGPSAGPSRIKDGPQPQTSNSPALKKQAQPSRPRQGSGSSRRISSSASISKRTDSQASHEPRSFVKGFDTSAHDNRPREGAKAPPPTPAIAPKTALAPSPPRSVMKSPDRTKTATKPSKKIFFISSPNSEDEDCSDDGSRGPSIGHGHKAASASSSTKQKQATVVQEVVEGPADGNDDEWDDEGSSSGWGSEYSTESDGMVDVHAAHRARQRQQQQQPQFAKRPSETQLKPRGPGLLSQLFHPDLIEAGKGGLSTADLARAHRSMPHMQHLHASHSTSDALDRQRANSSAKNGLRGAPADADFESSSDEEDAATLNEQPAGSGQQNPIAIAALQRRLEETSNLAPPQTPRTTRRAMLATELSESLRRNLLWERQTRTRTMGGPVPARFQSALPPVRPLQQAPVQGSTSSSVVQRGFHPPKRVRTDDGMRAPHPSPATQDQPPARQHRQQPQRYRLDHSPPLQEVMRRRHTTGTGLYLQAQQDRWTRPRRDSDVSLTSDSDIEDDYEPTRFDAFTDGLHHHGW